MWLYSLRGFDSCDNFMPILTALFKNIIFFILKLIVKYWDCFLAIVHGFIFKIVRKARRVISWSFLVYVIYFLTIVKVIALTKLNTENKHLQLQNVLSDNGVSSYVYYSVHLKIYYQRILVLVKGL